MVAQHQSHLASYLQNLRKMRQTKEEWENRKNENPAQWKVELEEQTSQHLVNINSAFVELLSEPDFRDYLLRKLHEQTEIRGNNMMIIPLINQAEPVLAGPKLALVASNSDTLMIQVCHIDLAGAVTLIDYFDDDAFLRTLHAAQECDNLITHIVDTLGEP